MIKSVLIAGLGGFTGTALRFLLSRYFQLNFVSVFPLGTFIINITGCFVIGIVAGIADKGNLLSNEWRLFLAVGLCGGFTTFSAFSDESLTLIRNNEFVRFTLYSGLSFMLGILAVLFGRHLVKLI